VAEKAIKMTESDLTYL